jgi:translation initiation factor IF-2
VKEVGLNFDCGISIVNFNDIREGDILEAFAEIEIKQKL